MEAEEFYNCAVSPLVTTPFATEWSPDNHISLITGKGVHIFELIPSPMCPHPTLKFSRSFIYPSDILPAHAFVNEVDSIIWNMKREEVYMALMEEAITPRISDITDTVVRIVKVEWSPQDLMHQSKCILAILTSAGAVELLYKIATDWFSICDLSSCWLNIVRDGICSNLKECVNKDSQFTTLVNNIRKLQACAMTWSKLQNSEQECFAYFVTAYRSSDIVIWKIPRIANHSQNINPEIVYKANLERSVKINMLEWITLNPNQYLILIGYFDGQIHSMKFESSKGSFKKESSEIYYSYSDNIPISLFKTISIDSSGTKVLASKGSFLLLLCLTVTGTLKSIQHLQVEGFTITGITSINSHSVLITTQDSVMLIIDTRSDELKIVNIKYTLSQTRVQYLGLAHSPNFTMFINITSPNSTYDHLVIREPSTIFIFTLKGEFWDPLNILNRNKLKNTYLRDSWDCLELIRIKASKALDPMTVLPVISNLESLSLYELQLSMWISVMIEVCKKKKVIQGIKNIVGEISEAQPLIFVHSACLYLKRLASKSELSKEQELSVSLLRMYLEVFLAGEDNEEETHVTNCVREALKTTAGLNSANVELCNICGQVIDDVPWNATKCPSGHKLPRCAITLLQVTTVEYLSCPICGQIFHPCLDKVFEEVRCLFCDVPALYDSRIFNVHASESSRRNLSKQQVRTSETWKDQGSEAPVEDQGKEKWKTTHTYSVIVNDDEDDSCRITETWQEF